MTEEEIWQLVQDNEKALRRICSKLLPPSRREELDEMYGAVVLERAHSIMNTYDAAKGAGPRHHLLVNVRWYAYKWINRQQVLRRRAGASIEDHEPRAEEDQDTSLRVDTILEGVPDSHAQILKWRYASGFTPAEIAEHLGCEIADVRRVCAEGLRMARGRRRSRREV